MTENERRILEIIKQNPFISQQTLAESISLSRPAVANIISSLIKKEYLLGKAYILNQRTSIVCIGAANLDKKVKTSGELLSYTSNPVNSTISIGGVVRNVAENLGRLDHEVTLISTVGNDPEWARIKALSEPFMNTDGVIVVEGESTGCYTALLDRYGEMYLGLADMSIYDKFTPELLIKKQHFLKNASCIVVDLNCPKATLEFIFAYAQKHRINVAVIAVSEPKMKHLPTDLKAIDYLFINKGELGAFVEEYIDSDEKLNKAIHTLLNNGVKNIVLTAGSNGVLFTSKEYQKWFDIKRLEGSKIIDVTGAGDSFSAAYISAWLNNQSIENCMLSGITNAYHTIQSEFTVRPNLTKHQLTLEMEKYYE
ncbi:carbohydrate kinase [Rodentibacter sp. Ppn85]|uniref:carbohydrate kinase n=1 Tax=Rodentibacter sp. Ppn85 TaxID=1908525 RepID=UPI000985065B|nr:carbohydrate kinase [Rodentibacter sp. Ppn85]OOF65451.1 carbohydrate kinase [Rodentibacter sp. Ppn85]